MPSLESDRGLSDYLRPELGSSATPLWLDMNDAQRRAHTKQMEAYAKKMEAEADQIRQSNRMARFWVGVNVLISHGTVFALGLLTGFVWGFSI